MASLHSRRWLRFTVSALLTLMTMLAGWLAGYKSGFDAGDKVYRYDSTYVDSYYIADLVTPFPNHSGKPPRSNGQDVAQLIADAVHPDSDGKETISFLPGNYSIVVSGKGALHRRVKVTLEALRSPRGGEPPESLEAIAES